MIHYIYPDQDSKHFELVEENDPINPDHYKSYSVETIDMMIAIYGKEKVAIHCELTAFKYRQRLGKKDNIEQDIKKEQWYLDKAAELRNDLIKLKSEIPGPAFDNDKLSDRLKDLQLAQANSLNTYFSVSEQTTKERENRRESE